ncbi:polyprenyl synthetase family protein [Paenibacillus beijingensis]|uniref:Farnesyl diphosphate synthase n=1 Tax=Paenibacillus beijingensis TaxID=1126833 RepID=A0A0D5NPR7_9BACL|nr:farnesyl diphosphate synthase [Paenibacillus beijingensis]AJY77251.1 polyprenyl synthetase [Paenibacillus beijingensis]
MSEQLTLQDYVAQAAAKVEGALREAVPALWDVPPKLREAMDYSLRAGGKRLRPVLVMAAAEAVRGQEKDAEASLSIACAIELVHTYSLIHDDLPAMDDDDFRRGKPTNHKVFGEAMAILAGDALLTHAFYLVTEGQKHGIDPGVLLSVSSDLARYAGAAGMVGGQAADIMGEQGLTSASELEYIHLHKTSDLIVFSVTAGAKVGGADGKQLDALALYGRNLGLAFQIQDDILDLIGDEAKLGKKTKSDVEQGKVTYPYLIGLDESRSLVEKLTLGAKEAVREAGLASPSRLLGIADYLMRRDH